MYAAEAAPSRAEEPATARHYGTIVVVGGGCYGSYYVRQLRRAAVAGRIAWTRVLVVDRDPACRVAREATGGGEAAGAARGAPPKHNDVPPASHTHHQDTAPLPTVVCADWHDFFDGYLSAASGLPASATRDAIVPSPLMPHLMFDWILARSRARWPTRSITTGALARPPATPWERAAPDGTRYVSFATWMCPVNCIEPARCPHTRTTRDWSLPPALRAFVDQENAAGAPLAGPVLLHCTHRVYGVGMFDTRDVLSADAAVRNYAEANACRILVGTVSHCHGALNVMEVGPPRA